LPIGIIIVFNKIKQAKEKVKIENKPISDKLNIGFYICVSNIVALILTMLVIK
jgi:hypothetical protein